MKLTKVKRSSFDTLEKYYEEVVKGDVENEGGGRSKVGGKNEVAQNSGIISFMLRWANIYIV